MRASFSLAVFLSLVYLAGGADKVRAQDKILPPAEATPGNAAPIDNAPAANPQNAAPQNGPANGQMQRNAQRRAQNEGRLRALMKDFGIDATETQDAVVAYLAEDESGKAAARGAARRLMIAIRADTTPDRMRDLIAIYKAAIDADHERRRAAQSALDAKIGFTLNPRLEAILWLLGVLGDGQTGASLNPPFPRGDWRGDNKPRGDNPPAANENQGGGNPRWGNPRDGRAPDLGMRRFGTVRGTVAAKSENWIDVQDGDGKIERFWPMGAGGEAQNVAAAPQNPAVNGNETGKNEAPARFSDEILQTLEQVKIGAFVRLDWLGTERKRVLSLDILQPQEPPQKLPETAPNPNEKVAAPKN